MKAEIILQILECFVPSTIHVLFLFQDARTFRTRHIASRIHHEWLHVVQVETVTMFKHTLRMFRQIRHIRDR